MVVILNIFYRKHRTALQVDRVRVRTTSGAAHAVAYDRLAPWHPLGSASTIPPWW
jgi:hypothetical protein